MMMGPLLLVVIQHCQLPYAPVVTLVKALAQACPPFPPLPLPPCPLHRCEVQLYICIDDDPLSSRAHLTPPRPPPLPPLLPLHRSEVQSYVCIDDDEAIDAASHAASEAYKQSSPEKSKAIKLDKVLGQMSPAALRRKDTCYMYTPRLQTNISS